MRYCHVSTILSSLLVSGIHPWIKYREVRKAILLNVPFAPETLEAIMTRTRDPEASIRRSLYDVVLCENLENPKQLSIAQRETLVRLGLRDRDPSVRAAASKLIGEWADKAEGELTAFVEIFDYDHVDEPDWMSDRELAFAPAEKALLSVLESRPEITNSLKFDGKNLFLSRPTDS